MTSPNINDHRPEPEKAFHAWLAEKGLEIEALIQRAQREWIKDQFIFRYRAKDGEWSVPHLVTWSGPETYQRVRGMIELGDKT